MADELENPVINEDAIDPEVLAELDAYDKTPVNPSERVKGAHTRTETASQSQPELPIEEPKAKQPDNSETEAEKSDRERDEKGRFKAKEDSPAENIPSEPSGEEREAPEVKADASASPEQKPEEKPESNFEKAKKERARQENLLKNFEADKAQFRAEKAAFERIVKERTSTLNGDRPRDEAGNVVYSSKEYFDAARDFYHKAAKAEPGPNGEDYADLAEKAEKAGFAAQQREAKTYQTQFEERQQQNALEVLKNEPDLADQNSPLAKELQSVFSEEQERSQKQKRNSIFQMLPDGFWYATEVAKLRRQAASVSELKEKLTSAQAEIKRLNALTAVNGSSPTQQGRTRDFDSLSTDEQMKLLERQSRQHAEANFEGW